MTTNQAATEQTTLPANPLGLSLSVLRNARWEREGTDYTAGGITSTHESLLLVGVVAGPRVAPLPRDMQVQSLTMRDGTLRGVAPVVLHPGYMTGAPFLTPVQYNEQTGTWQARRGMAGGNYATTSDSRVSDLVAAAAGHRFYGALSVHDRFE